MTAVQSDPTTPLTEDGAAPLAAALAAFQAEMPTVPKTKTADTGTYRYSYADLADVTKAAMPRLAAHGLSFATCPRYTDHGYELVGVLLHSSGESMEGALPIHGNSAQQLGSAITYARRYLFGCMTGVVTDDDDDGQSASKTAATTRVRQKPAGATTRVRQKPAGDPEPPAATHTAGGASVKQVQRIGILMSELGLSQRDKALDYVEQVIGRRVESRNDLLPGEAAAVIDALQSRGTPAVDPWAVPEQADGTPPTPTPPAPSRPPQPFLVGQGVARGLRVSLARVLPDPLDPTLVADLLTAVAGRRVETIEELTKDEGLAAAQALVRIEKGTMGWFRDNDGQVVLMENPPLEPPDPQ